ncbi:hypothetical protein SNEBB_005122 [Seison nebaliae]|nr:hypothetical protein SNEBB_005122 [Seison nebaliae]
MDDHTCCTNEESVCHRLKCLLNDILQQDFVDENERSKMKIAIERYDDECSVKLLMDNEEMETMFGINKIILVQSTYSNAIDLILKQKESHIPILGRINENLIYGFNRIGENSIRYEMNRISHETSMIPKECRWHAKHDEMKLNIRNIINLLSTSNQVYEIKTELLYQLSIGKDEANQKNCWIDNLFYLTDHLNIGNVLNEKEILNCRLIWLNANAQHIQLALDDIEKMEVHFPNDDDECGKKDNNLSLHNILLRWSSLFDDDVNKKNFRNVNELKSFIKKQDNSIKGRDDMKYLSNHLPTTGMNYLFKFNTFSRISLYVTNSDELHLNNISMTTEMLNELKCQPNSFTITSTSSTIGRTIENENNQYLSYKLSIKEKMTYRLVSFIVFCLVRYSDDIHLFLQVVLVDVISYSHHLQSSNINLPSNNENLINNHFMNIFHEKFENLNDENELEKRKNLILDNFSSILKQFTGPILQYLLISLAVEKDLQFLQFHHHFHQIISEWKSFYLYENFENIRNCAQTLHVIQRRLSKYRLLMKDFFHFLEKHLSHSHSGDENDKDKNIRKCLLIVNEIVQQLIDKKKNFIPLTTNHYFTLYCVRRLQEQFSVTGLTDRLLIMATECSHLIKERNEETLSASRVFIRQKENETIFCIRERNV